MSIENFPGNSRRASPPPVPNNNVPPVEEPQKVEAIVTGRVIRRKKPLGRRLMDTFFTGGGEVFKHVFADVLVPAIQDTVTNLITQTIERAVYGEVRTQQRPRGFRPGPYSTAPRTHISYDRQSVRPPTPYGSQVRQPSIQPLEEDIGEVILETSFIAQMVADKLYENIQEYGAVTVATFKELLGETAKYTDHKWGWTEGAEFEVRKVREGWLLTYPKAIHLGS